MYDPLILIISVIILAETSTLLVRRRGQTSRSGRSILVDTSVLIDGRILDIAEAGFVPGRLVIPRSVLGELQLLADGADHEKRARARNGLEVITKLQAVPNVNIEIHRDESEAREGVDNRLLALARQLNYELCTVDYNLQKVAQAEGIGILSINELSQKLRALYLPGEKLELLLKQKGQEKGQAIGYASDGTMVVVDNADKLMDQTVGVEIIRSLQTNSGKMMFAKLTGARDASNSPAPDANGRGRGTRRQAENRTDTSRERAPRVRQDRPARVPRSAQPSRAEQPRIDQPVTEQSQPQPTQVSKKPFNRNRRGGSGTPEDELLDLVNKQ